MNFGKLIDLPYKHKGRDFSGVDCYGLIHLAYKEFRGIILPEFEELDYSTDWQKKGENHIEDCIWQDWKEVTPPYKMYDGILFYYRSSKDVIGHIGMVIQPGRFIHIYEGTNSIVENLNNYWKGKIYKVMRYNG